MATKTLEQYTAEISKSSANARNALQNQINAIAGNLEQAQKQINENYAQQQNTLNSQRNSAASNASMQAAGSGGSFGGAANIANKKYYEQTFVPAQTQLNTNKSQALENAQTQANNNKLSLESQLASLIDQDNRLAWQAYNEALEREKERELQRRAIAAQRAATANYFGGGGGGGDKYVNIGQGNNYQFRNAQTGNAVKLGTYISQWGGNFNQQARDYIAQMAANGDANAEAVQNILKYNPNKKLAANTGSGYTANNYKYLSSNDNNVLNILGLKLV